MIIMNLTFIAALIEDDIDEDVAREIAKKGAND